MRIMIKGGPRKNPNPGVLMGKKAPFKKRAYFIVSNLNPKGPKVLKIKRKLGGTYITPFRKIYVPPFKGLTKIAPPLKNGVKPLGQKRIEKV